MNIQKALPRIRSVQLFHMRDVEKNVLSKFYEALHLMKVETPKNTGR